MAVFVFVSNICLAPVTDTQIEPGEMRDREKEMKRRRETESERRIDGGMEGKESEKTKRSLFGGV